MNLLYARTRLLPFLLAIACSDSGPGGPDDDDGSVVGRTATFQGLSVTLVRTEDNWESDNQFVTPDPGNRFYTVEVRYQNGSSVQRNFNPFDFEIETDASTRIDPTAG